MVQAQSKSEQQNSEADERFQRIRSEVHRLPQASLTILLRDIADAMEQQTVSDKIEQTLSELQPDAGPYEALRMQGGPFAQMITLLEKEQRTEDEEHHLRELGHQQAIGLLADWRPAPTDEEVKQVLNERVLERYGG